MRFISRWGVSEEKLAKIIQKARSEGARSLDLSSYLFSELPPSIGYLVELEELVMDGSGIRLLPSSISNLKKLKRLDLTGNHELTELPSTIGSLGSLEYLNLNGTGIRTLPDSLKNARALKVLDLFDHFSPETILASLPRLESLESLSIGQFTEASDLGPLRGLKNLRELTLAGVVIFNIPQWFGSELQLRKLLLSYSGWGPLALREVPNPIRQLRSLRSLSLPAYQLGEIPSWLGELPDLEELALWGYNGEHLSDAICKLANLRQLNLDHSQRLRTLPDSIGQLTALTDLSLDECTTFASLPDSIGKLRSLRRLTITSNATDTVAEGGYLRRVKLGNSLKELPETFGDLADLTELSLKGSRLERLPKSFGKLSSLQKLDLTETSLTSLPDSFGDLAALEELELPWVDLETLPETFDGLKSLKKLNLISANLRALPLSFGNLPSLQTLHVSSNLLQTLPESIGNLGELEALSLWCEELRTIPNSIANLRKLKTLTLSGPREISLPDGLAQLLNLDYLEFTNLHISIIKSNWVLPNKLHTLKFHNCTMEQWPILWQGLESLEELQFMDSNIEYIPDSICDMHAIETINVFDCPNFRGLPGRLGCLANLRVLHIAGCQVEELPHSIGDLKNLEYLSIRENKVKVLPPELGQVVSLKDPVGGGDPVLNVEGNPLIDPPPQVVAEGTAAILAYLRAKDDVVRRKLRELLQAHGVQLYKDPKRCQGLLYDALPEERLSIQLAVAAQQAGVPEALLKYEGKPRPADDFTFVSQIVVSAQPADGLAKYVTSADIDALVDLLTDRFAKIEALTRLVPDQTKRRASARRAVACWAFALGMGLRQ